MKYKHRNSGNIKGFTPSNAFKNGKDELKILIAKMEKKQRNTKYKITNT